MKHLIEYIIENKVLKGIVDSTVNISFKELQDILLGVENVKVFSVNHNVDKKEGEKTLRVINGLKDVVKCVEWKTLESTLDEDTIKKIEKKLKEDSTLGYIRNLGDLEGMASMTLEKEEEKEEEKDDFPILEYKAIKKLIESIGVEIKKVKYFKWVTRKESNYLNIVFVMTDKDEVVDLIGGII